MRSSTPTALEIRPPPPVISVPCEATGPAPVRLRRSDHWLIGASKYLIAKGITALFILATDGHMAIGLPQSLLGWPSLNSAHVVTSSLWMETQTQLTLDLMQMGPL